MRFQRSINLPLILLLLVSPIASFGGQRRKAAPAKPAAASATTVAASASKIDESGARLMADQITAAQLKDYLSFIASDELEGRDTPSRGLDIAAKFIATNLSRWGLKGAGDGGTFFQKIELRRAKFDVAQSGAEFAGQNFKLGEDFLAQPIQASVSGPLVYVGQGWVVRAKNIDPYKGVDVKDKIMVVSSVRRPPGIEATDVAGAPGEMWESPMSYAARHGAKAIVALPSYQELALWNRVKQSYANRGTLTMKALHAETSSAVPVITPSISMVATLFRGERLSGVDVFNRAMKNDPGQAFDFSADKQLDVKVSVAPETVTTQNVVAVAEGSDPQLKNEYVALGAHYDHVGVGAPVAGDAIYNGADDDGSGTVALLAMAETLARNPRPKRSTLFVWHAGEEKGLWGSRYFTQFPTVPLSQIIAQLNVDMIGRSKKEGDTKATNAALSGPNEIYVIGSKMMSAELGAVSERVNREYLNLNFNYLYDAPDDKERFFYRSDHYNYAEKGIPIIFYFSGVHEDYHRPGDSSDKIDYTKYEKVTRTIFVTAMTLANAPRRPVVDRPLPDDRRNQRD